MTLHIDILNPKATQLLRDLEDLKLIAIRKDVGDDFISIIRKLRNKAAKNAPSLDDITKEVEMVRMKRHASKG